MVQKLGLVLLILGIVLLPKAVTAQEAIQVVDQ
jgi:hypothetical protein